MGDFRAGAGGASPTGSGREWLNPTSVGMHAFGGRRPAGPGAGCSLTASDRRFHVAGLGVKPRHRCCIVTVKQRYRSAVESIAAIPASRSQDHGDRIMTKLPHDFVLMVL